MTHTTLMGLTPLGNVPPLPRDRPLPVGMHPPRQSPLGWRRMRVWLEVLLMLPASLLRPPLGSKTRRDPGQRGTHSGGDLVVAVWGALRLQGFTALAPKEAPTTARPGIPYCAWRMHERGWLAGRRRLSGRLSFRLGDMFLVSLSALPLPAVRTLSALAAPGLPALASSGGGQPWEFVGASGASSLR